MAKILNIDHRFLAGGALALSAGAAIYSTYKYKSLQRQQTTDNVYESKKMLNEYLVFHYGAPTDVLTYSYGPKDSLDFPKRCAELCMKHSKKNTGAPTRALDIGCAVGRSSFELAAMFDEVIGFDYSSSFIDACNLLKTNGKMSYSVVTVGDLENDLEAVVNPSIDRKRLIFQQGDACDLSPNLGQFDCVLAANLICRLHTPKDFLNRLASLVVSGGILVITSPYTFLREYTPRDKWIGGYRLPDGTEFTGFDGLKKTLAPAFDFVTEEDMPFFIRETARKNQWTVAHATVWKRKS